MNVMRKSRSMMLMLSGGLLLACGQAPAPQTAPRPAETATADGSTAPAGQSPAAAITFTTNPDPPRSGENRVQVTVHDSAGSPVTDAEVMAVFYMPAMPSMSMPEMRSSVSLTGDGKGSYSGSGDLVMGGTWNVTVNVSRAGRKVATGRFTVIAK